ncbi:MAG TPA: IPT/TIG domain-containing protein, partial [Candidatus Goldiibacteriota bacterium]|nr:IPT/TIG domain-containing protein [Candidatus Goldiibacteriota bacterium]
LDYIIISNVARGGAETLPISEPAITDISPATGSTAGGTAVTITGTEFATGATVTFGGVSATDIVVVSATEITCVTPAGTAGAVDVVITNTDTGTVTSTGGFTYIAPSIVDVHYTSKVIPQDFTILLTDSDITGYQTKPYEREEQLNVIDTFDFAFDTVSASAPLEFFKFLNTRANNTLKVKDKAGIVIYAGNVSGVKSNTELDFASKVINIESSPLIESVSTSFAAYDIAATSPVKVVKQLLDAAVSLPYSVAKLYGLASLLPGINISVDTDGEEDNTKSIIQSICEYFNIGVYLDALTVRAHVAQVLPDNATDILPYLINSQPKFTSRGDLYADKIMLTYSTAVGAAEASVTSGSGDTVKEIQISAPIFMDAVSAQAAADRALEIYSQKIYEAEIEADKTAMFKLGDTIKYVSPVGNFICLIIGKLTTRNQITYRVLGAPK